MRSNQVAPLAIAMQRRLPMASPVRRGIVTLGLMAAVALASAVPALAQDDQGGHDGMEMGGTAMPGATPGAAAGAASASMAGHDMGPVNAENAPAAPPNARGNQPLTPTVVDGVKEFRLTTRLIRWSILPDVEVAAYAYNDQVPGPLLRFAAGDRVRILVTNDLPEPTSVHWHGLELPNAQDGAAGVTQPAIAPGETFTYEFVVPNTPGTFFYHTHVAADRQQALGLYGALIIDGARDGSESAPTWDQEYVVELGEWRVVDGQTHPAMEIEGALPNYFTINGKSYPATDTIRAKVGDRVLVRFIGTGQFIHPMHIHGGPFQVVATDGNPVPAAAQLTKDTVLVGPGERYDVVWEAREPGKWLLHCHIGHHITNDGVEVDGAGGLTMVIEVEP